MRLLTCGENSKADGSSTSWWGLTPQEVEVLLNNSKTGQVCFFKAPRRYTIEETASVTTGVASFRAAQSSHRNL